MESLNVLQAAKSLIYTTLGGDTNITNQLSPGPNNIVGVYSTLAPQGVNSPYITYQNVPNGSPESRYGTDASLAMLQVSFLCKVTTDGLDENLASSIAEIMGNDLENIKGVAYAQWYFNFFERQLYENPPFLNSKSYRQVGGRYTFLARPIS